MTTTPKLLPCPFCGDEPDIMDGPDTSFPYVVCIECDVRLEGPYEAHVVAAWNRRPSPWIACATRMPEREGRYLVCYRRRGRPLLRAYIGDWLEDRWSCLGDEEEVVYWSEIAALPPPPAPEGER